MSNADGCLNRISYRAPWSRSRAGGPGGVWGTLLLLLLLLPGVSPAQERQGIQIPNPGADLWRAVRQRQQAELPAPPVTPKDAAPGVDLWREINRPRPQSLPTGRSQVQGVDSGRLINPLGNPWREFRMQRLIPYGGYALGGVALLILLFFLLRGKVRIKQGACEEKLHRYTVYERTIHWFMAIVFLFLAATGSIILFGRSLLLPWMGPEWFAPIASASKEGHNLFGPLFLLALLLLFVKFVGRNIYEKGDLTWLLRGGGLVGRREVPSNFFNMGEKTLFWLLILAGVVIVASGLLLLFPVFGQGREWMALSEVAHGVTTLVMIAVIMGHIYIGTIGMEGALEGMKTGYCDLNWARAHHAWWADNCIEKGEVLSGDEVARRQGAKPPSSAVTAPPPLETGQ